MRIEAFEPLDSVSLRNLRPLLLPGGVLAGATLGSSATVSCSSSFRESSSGGSGGVVAGSGGVVAGSGGVVTGSGGVVTGSGGVVA